MRNSSGFTLIELMIALAVFAILAAVSVPNYITWLPKRHLQSSAIDVQGTIYLAKMTAIKENTNVVLEFDIAKESYLVFIDTDEDGSLDSDERTVRSNQMSTGINLISTDFGADQLTFNSRGLADDSGDIILRNKDNEDRTINVTLTGMSRIN